jgi:hypothetical protein
MESEINSWNMGSFIFLIELCNFSVKKLNVSKLSATNYCIPFAKVEFKNVFQS